MISDRPPPSSAKTPANEVTVDTGAVLPFVKLGTAEPVPTADDRPHAVDGPHIAALAALMANESRIALFQASIDGDIQVYNSIYADLCERIGSTVQRPAIPGLLTLVGRTAATGQVHTRPVSLEVKGVKRHYWCRYVPILNEYGQVSAVAGALQDWTASLGRVNDAVRDQQRFRDFARACSDWFWETDAQFRLSAVSDRLSALLGHPASALIGKPLDAIGRFDKNLAGDSPFARARHDLAPFREQLVEIEDEAGDVVLFHLSGVPLFDLEGQFKGFRGAGMNVTRQYVMEEEARAVRNNLEHTLDELHRKNAALDVVSGQAQSALKTKNEFLASMSHELRTPLNAIIGFAEAMQMSVFGELNPHYIGYANDIRNAGRHLLGLIDDVLDVSVIESGEVNLAPEQVSLAQLLAQARSLVTLRAEAKRLDLSGVTLESDVLVEVDQRRALQIFANLLTNAVKFTPEGGRIGVTVKTEGSWALIDVADTGIGIAAEHHEAVFEKFQQCVSDTYKGKPEGTGLGLHISRQLARLMQGDITLDSAPGHGATFTVRLPLA